MKRIITGIIILLNCLNSYSQDLTFRSYVDKNNITTDEYIMFTVESSERVKLNNLQLKDFAIRQGPYTSSSSQTTIINGKFKSKKEFKSTFKIAPKKDGKLVIEAIKVNYKGKDYLTDRIEINVSKGEKVLINSTTKTQAPKNNSKIFAKITSSKSKPYIGENLLIKYKIYQSAYYVRNLDITDYDMPMSNDFWTELIEPKNKQWKEEQEIINGIVYRVYTLKKELVYPQKTGKITIPSFEVKTVYNTDFFGRGGIRENIKSNSVTLNVKSLPPNPPANYNGQIGSNYKLNVKLNNPNLKVDDALDIQITISGKGNLQELNFPKIEYPLDFEKYPEEIKSNLKITENGTSGKKQLNQLLIPRFHGEYEIPAIEFCYFDIRSKKYKTLKYPAKKITVEKNKTNSPTNSANFNKAEQQNVVVLNDNIHHIKTKTELYDYSNPIFGSLKYWIILISIPLILIISLLILTNKDQFTNNEKAQNRRLIKEVNSKFINAKKQLENNQNIPFYKEVYQIWQLYLSKKFKIDISELNRDKIIEKLNEKGIDNDDINALEKILNSCEMAQYSPLSNEDAQQLYHNSKNVLTKFEKHV